MPSYLHPGVYIEEIPSGSRPIEGVSTSTTAFVGATFRGPVNSPTLIGTWDEYVAQFGDFNQRTGIQNEEDATALAVRAFYQNGGKASYICRMLGGDPETASVTLTNAEGDVLEVRASSPGAWANNLAVAIYADYDKSDEFDFFVGTYEQGDVATDETKDLFVPIATESFKGLSLDPAKDNFIEKVVNSSSKLVTVVVVETATDGPTANDKEDKNSFTQFIATSGFILTNDDGNVMTIRAQRPGAWVNNLAVAIYQNGANFDFVVGTVDDTDVFSPIPEETFEALSMVEAAPNFFKKIINSKSKLVSVAVAVPATGAPTFNDPVGADPADRFSVFPEIDGPLDLTATADEYNSFYTSTLRKVPDVSIIVLPGKFYPTNKDFIDATISHCEATMSRVVIIDIGNEELNDAGDVEAIELPTSTYSVLFYPWVTINNPLFNADTNPTAATTIQIAPSAIAAGMWTKIDGKRGVWKAPAGVETRINVAGVAFDVEDLEQDFLNPLGVNCIRKRPGYGPVFWGSRTLATKADPEWRYVPVRRTAIYIEQSIFNGIQWAVFEPNDHPLWSSLRANIGSFMNGMFRAGAFQGKTADEAYFVRCGLGDTMTQGDIDRGQVIIVVGFAPLKPAEFVILRLQQKVGQQ